MGKTATIDHKHRKIALHSPEQQAKFYALVADLGHDKKEAKLRAIRRFGVECFNDLTKGQMMWLIERLQNQYDVKQAKT